MALRTVTELHRASKKLTTRGLINSDAKEIQFGQEDSVAHQIKGICSNARGPPICQKCLEVVIDSEIHLSGALCCEPNDA